MRGHLLLSSSVAVLLAVPAVATSANAAPWSRSYVITHYEPAWYFGGAAGFHKAGTLQPGSDCPKGSIADVDYHERLKTPWRDAKDVDRLLNPPNTDPGTVVAMQERLLTFRGFRDGINVYINPFSAPDPGIQEVTGKIAEGFDLDGNARTGGFTSPTGEKGIDNAFYRAWGCLNTYRDAPYEAILGKRTADEMAMEGLFSLVVRVSGTKDPMNDDNATVEVGFSPDQMTVGGTGTVLADYSYRLVKTAEYSKVHATVKNGTVEIDQVDNLHLPRPAWFPNQYGDLDLHKSRMRLELNPDGTVSGLIGGYRDWREIFVEHHFTQTGGHEEQRDAGDSMAMYYALKRNADGLPDPKTGKNMGISMAYRFKAQPAFVVESNPSARATIALTTDIREQIHQIDEHRDAFYKALATRQIQPMPADSTEGGYGGEHPQQQADGSWKLVKTDKNVDERNASTVPIYPEHKTAPKPKEQQVLNTVPGVASTTR